MRSPAPEPSKGKGLLGFLQLPTSKMTEGKHGKAKRLIFDDDN